MRVLTMNLFGEHAGWPERRAVLIAGLAGLSADVAAFQEVVKSPDYDQVADVLGPGYELFHQAGRSADGVGASIASRWPLEVVREADLHVGAGGDPTGWIGSLAVVEIAAPGPIGTVLLAHHKPTWQSGMERVRELQAVAAARLIEELVDGVERPVILAGDLDATPAAASMRFWTGRQSLEGLSVCYQDAWEVLHPGQPGHTFTPRNPLVSDAWLPRPGRRIDYILIRCATKGAALGIGACELVFDAPVDGVWASDHFGVTVDFTG